MECRGDTRWDVFQRDWSKRALYTSPELALNLTREGLTAVYPVELDAEGVLKTELNLPPEVTTAEYPVALDARAYTSTSPTLPLEDTTAGHLTDSGFEMSGGCSNEEAEYQDQWNTEIAENEHARGSFYVTEEEALGHIRRLSQVSTGPRGCREEKSAETRIKMETRKWKPVLESFSAHRLRPIRQRTKNAIMSVLEDSYICLEFFKVKEGQLRVLEVFRISPDGQQVVTFQPNAGKGVPVGSQPPQMPPLHMCKQYDCYSMPSKYIKRYQYAARFVNLVGSKTPKVTLYTGKAKCMMMENRPDADFEVLFYEGVRITGNSGHLRVSLPYGGIQTVDLSAGTQFLPTDIRQLCQYAQQCQQKCLNIESKMSQLARDVTDIPMFPVTIGRRPCTKADGTNAPEREILQPQTEVHLQRLSSHNDTRWHHAVNQSQTKKPGLDYQLQKASRPIDRSGKESAPDKNYSVLQSTLDEKYNSTKSYPDITYKSMQNSPDITYNIMQNSPDITGIPYKGHTHVQSTPDKSYSHMQSTPDKKYNYMQSTPDKTHNHMQGSPHGICNNMQSTPDKKPEEHVHNMDTRRNYDTWNQNKSPCRGGSRKPTVERSVFSPEIGRGYQLSNGDLLVQFISGCELCITRPPTLVTYADVRGHMTRYHGSDPLPEEVRDKLQLVSLILCKLEAAKAGFTPTGAAIYGNPSILCSVFMPRFGRATQLSSGEVLVQFTCGSELSIQASPMAVTHTDAQGRTRRYQEEDQLPDSIRDKMLAMPTIMCKLDDAQRILAQRKL